MASERIGAGAAVVQRTPASDGSGGGGFAGALRGMSYDEQSAALAPRPEPGMTVQRKPDDGAGDDAASNEPPGVVLEIGRVAKGCNKILSLVGKLAKADESLSKKKKITRFIDSVTGLRKALSDYIQSAQKLTAVPQKYAKTAVKLAKVAEDVAALEDTRELQAFLDDPSSSDAAVAWGQSVGAKFDVLADLVGFIPEDMFVVGFIGNYFKGLLSAPSNYIKYFITLQKTYYDHVDKEAEIGRSQSHGTNYAGHEWEGPLTGIFCGADPDLAEYMWAHKDDLMDEAKLSPAKAKLLQAITPVASSDPDKLTRWTKYIQSHGA